MRYTYLTITAFLISMNSFAQNNNARHVKYSDEGFDTKMVEKKYSFLSPGRQFCNRMDVLYKNSKTGYITQDKYDAFLETFKHAVYQPSSNTGIANKLQFMSRVLQDINVNTYNNADSRNTMYSNAFTVYKAVVENWGDEVINMAISNAYFNIKEYVTVKAVDNVRLKNVSPSFASNPIEINTSVTDCNYTVMVDRKIAKDKIEVYFSDYGMYNKAATKYPSDILLMGPVPAWESRNDESQVVKGLMKAYAEIPNQTGHYVYSANIDSDKSTNVVQPLNSDMKWFVWVFRNDKLYYTYMVQPCSNENRCNVQ